MRNDRTVIEFSGITERTRERIGEGMKMQSEITDLKTQWIADPCWDIEDATGFEEYKTELLIFRLKQEKRWLEERLKEHTDFRTALMKYIEPHKLI